MLRSSDNDVEITLRSGRRIPAYGLVLGMTAFGELDVSEGYDSYLVDHGGLTPDERREIAEHMIRRWREWGGL